MNFVVAVANQILDVTFCTMDFYQQNNDDENSAHFFLLLQDQYRGDGILHFYTSIGSPSEISFTSSSRAVAANGIFRLFVLNNLKIWADQTEFLNMNLPPGYYTRNVVYTELFTDE